MLTSEDLFWNIAEVVAVTAVVGLMAAFKLVAVQVFLSCLVAAAIGTALMIGLYMCFGEDNKSSYSHRY
ncbi:MAG: hypothetical protein K2X50_07920 [Gammaproteobacteria bacterium]|nr:hypothetical protein [Gammaproteobacteria bacterium]